jgi:hypothetical protein
LARTPQGTLTIFPVTGGSFEGERLRGKVLAVAADWVTAHGNGTFTLDLRVTLETDDGGLIHMTFTGVRDDANHYFRTVPRFESAAPSTRSSIVCLQSASGIRPEGPVHVIEEIYSERVTGESCERARAGGQLESTAAGALSPSRPQSADWWQILCRTRLYHH